MISVALSLKKKSKTAPVYTVYVRVNIPGDYKGFRSREGQVKWLVPFCLSERGVEG